jgi:hypothetical protein
VVISNNRDVVPHDGPNDGFNERPEGNHRILSIFGGGQGTSMLEAKQGGTGPVWFSLQVQVGDAAANQPHVTPDSSSLKIFKGLPSWLTNNRTPSLPKSTWKFTTSEGVEWDAVAFAFGKGSFFLTDSTDADGIVHEVHYVGLGATTSKGPVPFGLGAGISNVDMRSGGVIFDAFGSPPKAKELGPMGIILSGQVGDGIGASIDVVLFSPPRVRAVGFILSQQFVLPGVGFTAMPCFFTVDS